jgi:DNA invertase Pin-like site-specific DNA recombinase
MMKKTFNIKYNRLSHKSQSGDRYQLDKTAYDHVFMDVVSGTVKFKDRPYAKELINLIEKNKASCYIILTIEEQSRLGRNMADVFSTLSWLDEAGVNVVVKNLGIESRPNGKPNPIWSIISATLSSLYFLELENIKERTRMGMEIYRHNNNGNWGRPRGTLQSPKDFLARDSTQNILRMLEKGRTIKEITSTLRVGSQTIYKAKRLAQKYYPEKGKV